MTHQVKIMHDYPGAFEPINATMLEMSDEFYDWLNDNVVGWRWIECPVDPYIIVEVTDPDHALMLKLTWGGQ